MNSTAIKEAVATGYPREKMYGVWWSGAEPDVLPAGEGAKGYNALVFLAPAGRGAVHADIVKYVYDKGQGTGKKDEIGEVLYNRGMVSAMFGVEAVRKAQEKFGKKPLTGEQVRWGLEHLEITPEMIKKLGMTGFMEPIHTSCENHEGAHAAMIETWDGKKWNVVPNSRYESDMSIIGPMIQASAKKYAEEKKLPTRDCSKEDGA
jgi:branched-chain amino acid transport system substrate-binding protein